MSSRFFFRDQLSDTKVEFAKNTAFEKKYIVINDLVLMSSNKKSLEYPQIIFLNFWISF